MRPRNLNYIAILSLLVVTALMAQHFQKQRPNLQIDLKSSLHSFWATQCTEAEVTGAGHVRLRVWTEPNLRETQRNWTFALSRWVAARHPEVKLQSLAVTDSGTEQPLQENNLGNPSDGILRIRYFEAARSQLLEEVAQRQLDKELGVGHALALVDATNRKPVASWLPNVPSDLWKSSDEYGSVPKEEYPGQDSFTLAKIEACVVIQRESQREQATRIVATSLHFDKNRGDRLRAVLLREAP